MCIHTHSELRKLHMVVRLAQSFIEDKNYEFMAQLCLLLIMFVMVPLTLIIRVVSSIVRLVIRMT